MQALDADEKVHDAEPATPEEDDVFPEEEPEIEAPGIKHVGVWTGTSSLRHPQRDVDFCKKNGINRIDVIVNDHSRSREPRGFDTHDIEKIVRLCSMASAAGIETHLMSWIMPHERYIDEAAEALIPLAAAAKVASIQWDAEEPWTKARARMSYDKAAKRIADAFSSLSCPMGVNGIGYTHVKKFGPIAEICDYIVPQCYSTKSSKQAPETVVPKFHRRYRKLFGKGAFAPPGVSEKPIVIGLAAYRQKGIPGHSIETAMRTALAGAQTLEGVDTVIYWSLSWIRRNSRVARVVRSIRQLPDVA